MLFDPKWGEQKEAQKDLVYEGVSLREFAAWLETKDPKAQYCYINSTGCAIAQFLKWKGRERFNLPVLPSWLNMIVMPGEAYGTFGKAAARAKSTISSL